MAEIRVNTTGTLKLFDADDSHSAGIAAGTVTANETLMTLNTADITFSIPKIVIGDATAEDTSIVFDGNAQDFYIGLDDSADDLIIGLGSAVLTDKANYYISIAADIYKINTKMFYCISPKSPIGKLLIGKKLDDKIEFNNQVIKIIKIL